MVIYGQRFDYSEVRTTEAQERVARCRAEAARKGREQARRWAAGRRAGRARHGLHVAPEGAKPPKGKAPLAKYDIPESHGQTTFEYQLGEHYMGHYSEYSGGESLEVQYVVGELYRGDLLAAHFVAGQYGEGDDLGLFFMMKEE